jgi:hypothetical protein
VNVLLLAMIAALVTIILISARIRNRKD